MGKIFFIIFKDFLFYLLLFENLKVQTNLSLVQLIRVNIFLSKCNTNQIVYGIPRNYHKTLYFFYIQLHLVCIEKNNLLNTNKNS